MPMPVAAGLYGVLLGLGFTTFVLTFGVCARRRVSRSGDPGLGAMSDSRSGSGGRFQIVALAPITDRQPRLFMLRLMAERPRAPPAACA